MTRERTKLAGPQVHVVGVNYSTTPLLIREKLSIPKSQMQEALACLQKHVSNGIILATCNRTEVYAVAENKRSSEQVIRRFLEEWSGVQKEELEPYLYYSKNYTAMRRLSRITAGLYSMIIGEYEILGQVRQALEDAERAQMVNLPLRNLFQHAIRTGRRVRDETDISKNALSVSSVAVDLATKVASDIHNCRVLLIGAGEAGKLVARALSERGVPRITVTSRSAKNAQELASILGGNYVNIDEMHNEMKAADIVITCTGAPHFVLHREIVERVVSARPERPLVIVDIAVPRDVEPEVEQIEGVFLYDIDDIDQASELNRKDRESEANSAMAIIDEEMENLLTWWQGLEVKPTITALTQMAEDIRQHQLNMSLKKLPLMNPEEQEVLEAMTKAIINKMLHHPIRCLKENKHRNGDLVKTVYDLFALNERGQM